MQLSEWFSLIQERVTRRTCSNRWSTRRRTSWPLSVALESLETRCLLAAGDLDPSFGIAGRVTTTIGSEASGQDVAIQSDGKIIVAGYSNIGSGNHFAVVRYNANGNLDRSFGRTGVVTTDFDPVGAYVLGAYANSMAIQQDSKIVVAGTWGSSIALARYCTDGSLDTSFGGTGKVVTEFGLGNSVAIQSDGKIIVAGLVTERSDFGLARYNSDGSLDISFGGTGIITTEFAPNGAYANSVTIQNDNKIVVAGYSDTGSGGDFAVVRYNVNGSLDTSFSGTGKLITDFGAFDYSNDVTIQSDGKIVVVGHASNEDGSNNYFAIARYKIDGSLDTNFGGTGQVVTKDLGGSVGRSVAIQSDNKIVVAGNSDMGYGNRFTVVRYNSNGTLDTSFGAAGIVTKDFGTEDIANSMVIQRDGKIVVVGFSSLSIAIARFEGDITKVALPVRGGRFTVSLEAGQIHFRSTNGKDAVVPAPANNDIQIDGSPANDRLTLDRSWSSFTGTITFNGLDGNDSLDARAIGLNVTFNGGDDRDTFLGGSGNDSVDGGPGNDSLIGGNGKDSINGGADNDRITGDAGDDLLIGGTGNDSLSGGTGNDTLLGDAGRDTLKGDSGNDVIDGGDDNDNLQGSDGNDSLRGGNGNDFLFGGMGSDLLIGSAGNDQLFGEAGTDTLLGESGNDLLFGGTGLDTINPGSGTDHITDTTRVINTLFTFDFDDLVAGLAVF